MNLFPSEEIIYHSELLPEEAQERLAAHTEPIRQMRLELLSGAKTKSFEGTVRDQMFRIRRIGWFSRSFTPLITGMFYKQESGSVIEVKINTPLYAKIAAGFFGVAVLVLLVLSVIQGVFITLSLIPPLVGFFIFYGINYRVFRSEKNKTERELAHLFEAAPIE